MKKRSDAFTLLECLVAIAITALLGGVMTAVATRALRLWSDTEAEQSQAIAAEQVLSLIERDLEALHAPRDGSVCFAVDVLDSATALANHGWRFDAGPMKPSGVVGLRLLPAADADGFRDRDAARFGLSGAWLRFMTTNVESGGGLPVVVAYQLVRRPVTGNPVVANSAPVRYGLYRSAISASESFASGSDVTGSAYASGNNNPSSALSAAYRQARNVTNPSHANLLAPNVVDLGCWLYVRGTDGGLVRVFPADAADASHHGSASGVTADVRLPEAVDVMVRILSPAGVVAVDAIEHGQVARPAQYSTDAEWWWGVVEEHSRVFSRRIAIARFP